MTVHHYLLTTIADGDPNRTTFSVVASVTSVSHTITDPAHDCSRDESGTGTGSLASIELTEIDFQQTFLGPRWIVDYPTVGFGSNTTTGTDEGFDVALDRCVSQPVTQSAPFAAPSGPILVGPDHADTQIVFGQDPAGPLSANEVRYTVALRRSVCDRSFDLDADGLSDCAEIDHGTDPGRPDTDGDGRTDGDEVNGAPTSDPLKADTDGDSASDGEETSAGSDPNNPNSTPTNPGGTPVSLTVSQAGTGSGTVTSSPAGIACGSVCTANFARGSTVTLSPVATLGSHFVGFSGACSGPSCSVTLDGAAVVAATFDPNPACSDSVDNDGDGLTDFHGAGNPATDPGCLSAADNDEANPVVLSGLRAELVIAHAALIGPVGVADTGTHAAIITGPSAQLAEVSSVCVADTWAATTSFVGGTGSVQAFWAFGGPDPDGGLIPSADYRLTLTNDSAKGTKTFTIFREGGNACSPPGRRNFALSFGLPLSGPGVLRLGVLGLVTTADLRSLSTSLSVQVELRSGGRVCAALNNVSNTNLRPRVFNRLARVALNQRLTPC